MEIGWRDIELVVDLSRTYLIQILDLYGFLKFDNVRTLQNQGLHKNYQPSNEKISKSVQPVESSEVTNIKKQWN